MPACGVAVVRINEHVRHRRMQVLTLLAVASGPLALVGKPVGTAPGYKNASVGSAPLGTDVRVWQMGNTAALFGCGVLVFLVLTMSEAGRIRLGHKK
jgi:hypothetical protein